MLQEVKGRRDHISDSFIESSHDVPDTRDAIDYDDDVTTTEYQIETESKCVWCRYGSVGASPVHVCPGPGSPALLEHSLHLQICILQSHHGHVSCSHANCIRGSLDIITRDTGFYSLTVCYRLQEFENRISNNDSFINDAFCTSQLGDSQTFAKALSDWSSKIFLGGVKCHFCT